MKIALTGATGFIGKALLEALQKRGEELVVLTRSLGSKSSNLNTRYVLWRPDDSTSIVNEIDGCEAVIHLAGESIRKRWSAKQKLKILESRVHGAQVIVNSIKRAAFKPKALISASAVGSYGPRGNEILAEDAKAGEGFLAETCKVWESHAIRVEDFDVRVVRLRIGLVLDKSGGALKLMLIPFRLGVGGWLGNGNQWMSWITRDDLVRLILFCLDHSEARGVVNAVSPQPVTNKAFSLVLAQVLKRPCLMPVPGFILKLLLGELSELLLTGQRVIPKKAEQLGFSFHHPEIRRALESILA
ncbi:MAG: TIGR01777 family protein [Candidatus Omnitrophica bacterium]|nr:TIGR01777 family protein [Candidatus Omnitrophota bacterium]